MLAGVSVGGVVQSACGGQSVFLSSSLLVGLSCGWRILTRMFSAISYCAILDLRWMNDIIYTSIWDASHWEASNWNASHWHAEN